MTRARRHNKTPKKRSWLLKYWYIIFGGLSLFLVVLGVNNYVQKGSVLAITTGGDSGSGKCTYGDNYCNGYNRYYVDDTCNIYKVVKNDLTCGYKPTYDNQPAYQKCSLSYSYKCGFPSFTVSTSDPKVTMTSATTVVAKCTVYNKSGQQLFNLLPTTNTNYGTKSMTVGDPVSTCNNYRMRVTPLIDTSKYPLHLF